MLFAASHLPCYMSFFLSINISSVHTSHLYPFFDSSYIVMYNLHLSSFKSHPLWPPSIQGHLWSKHQQIDIHLQECIVACWWLRTFVTTCPNLNWVNLLTSTDFAVNFTNKIIQPIVLLTLPNPPQFEWHYHQHSTLKTKLARITTNILHNLIIALMWQLYNREDIQYNRHSSIGRSPPSYPLCAQHLYYFPIQYGFLVLQNMANSQTFYDLLKFISNSCGEFWVLIDLN